MPPICSLSISLTKSDRRCGSAPGADLSGKVLSLADGFSAAFANPLPSLAPMDLLIGIVGAVLIRLIVYVKGKNAKKYRKGIEYGSARWGNAEDIKPYTDPVFQNNVLLTQTERLTMNSRPKQPKYARNKNILVIGGSGSGKTRFFVKPNLNANALKLRCNRPERNGFSRVREALTAGRVSDKGAEHDKLQKKHEIQSLCLSPQRKRHFETGKYFDCQHQRGRGKSRGRFLDKIGTALLLRPYRLHLVRSPGGRKEFYDAA